MKIADTLDVLNDLQQSNAALQIVLISDLQQGSQLEALQAYEWQEDVQLAVRTVAVADPTNANVQLIAGENETETDNHQRARVSNASDSSREQFDLVWLGNDRVPTDNISVYVPPGETRVVRIPLRELHQQIETEAETTPQSQRSRANLTNADGPPPTQEINRLQLSGDNCEFDNTFYFTPLRQEDLIAVYIGRDRVDDPQGLPYFLERALIEDSQRKVTLKCQTADQSLSLPGDGVTRLVVVSDRLAADQLDQLQEYVNDGGTLLFVLTDAAPVTSLAKLLQQDELGVEEATGDYVMFGEIDFSHPLFNRFADPRYNDFTRIRFSKHRRLTFPESSSVQVVARFDNGDPGVLEQLSGTGRLIVLTSGWHPADGRFALSSKFVPFIAALLDKNGVFEPPRLDYRVNERVSLPPRVDATSTTRQVHQT